MSPELPDPALQDETDSGVEARRRKAVAALLASAAVWAGVAGCTQPERGSEVDPERAASTVPTGLAASLEVGVKGDSVYFTLYLTNTTAAPVTLRFPTAQRYDFLVAQDGTEVWRWSADRMFAQVVTTDTIAAGETVDYRATWDARGRSGAYDAEGKLLATNRPVQLSTGFDLRSGAEGT